MTYLINIYMNKDRQVFISIYKICVFYDLDLSIISSCFYIYTKLSLKVCCVLYLILHQINSHIIFNLQSN